MKYFVEHGATIVVKIDHSTSLSKALKKGHFEIAKYLVESGAMPKFYKNNTLLHLAARDGNLEELKFILSCGINIHSENAKGETALQIAAHQIGGRYNHDYFKIMTYLVEQGADINHTNKARASIFLSGLRALQTSYYKIPHMYFKTIRYFLQKGADPEVKNNVGNTVWKVVTQSSWQRREEENKKLLNLLSFYPIINRELTPLDKNTLFQNESADKISNKGWKALTLFDRSLAEHMPGEPVPQRKNTF